MLVLKNLQLCLFCSIKHILYPFQIFGVAFSHKFWFGDVCVHVPSLTHDILSLLGVLFNQLVSRWINKVDLNLRGGLVQIDPVFSENIVVEVFLLVCRSSTLFRVRISSTKELNLICVELNFS